MLQGLLPDSPFQYQLLGLNLLCLLSQVLNSLYPTMTTFSIRTAWQNSTQSWRGCPPRRCRTTCTSSTQSALSSTSWRVAITRCYFLSMSFFSYIYIKLVLHVNAFLHIIERCCWQREMYLLSHTSTSLTYS